jgi:hypothetical protein
MARRTHAGVPDDPTIFERIFGQGPLAGSDNDVLWLVDQAANHPVDVPAVRVLRHRGPAVPGRPRGQMTNTYGAPVLVGWSATAWSC